MEATKRPRFLDRLDTQCLGSAPLPHTSPITSHHTQECQNRRTHGLPRVLPALRDDGASAHILVDRNLQGARTTNRQHSTLCLRASIEFETVPRATMARASQPSLEAMMEAREELKRKVKRTSAHIKCVKRRHSCMVTLQETKAQPRILRRLSVLSEYADDPVTVGAALLQHHWKRRMEGGTPSADAVQCCTTLLTAKRSLLEDSMRGVNEERKLRIAKYVLRWMKDWFLYQWLHDANTSTGVAPSTDLLFKRYNAITEASVASEGADLSTTHSSHRAWAARWRCRWYVRIGQLQVAEPMELHEKRTKAPAVSMTCKR